MLGFCPISGRPISGEVGGRAALETPPASVLFPSWFVPALVAVGTTQAAGAVQAQIVATVARSSEASADWNTGQATPPADPLFAAFRFWCGTCCTYWRDSFNRAEIGPLWDVQAGNWSCVHVPYTGGPPAHDVIETTDADARINCLQERPDDDTAYALWVKPETVVDAPGEETKFLVWLDDGRYAVEWHRYYADGAGRTRFRIWEVDGEQWTLHAAYRGGTTTSAIQVIAGGGQIGVLAWSDVHGDPDPTSDGINIPADIQTTRFSLGTGDAVSEYARFSNVLLERAFENYSDCAHLYDGCFYWMAGGYGPVAEEEWDVVSGTWTANATVISLTESDGLIKTKVRNPDGTNEYTVSATLFCIDGKARLYADFVDADNCLYVEIEATGISPNRVYYVRFFRSAGGVPEQIGFTSSLAQAAFSGSVSIRIRDGKAAGWAGTWVTGFQERLSTGGAFAPLGVTDHSARCDTAAIGFASVTPGTGVSADQIAFWRMHAAEPCFDLATDPCGVCREGTIPQRAVVTTYDFPDVWPYPPSPSPVVTCERTYLCGYEGTFTRNGVETTLTIDLVKNIYGGYDLVVWINTSRFYAIDLVSDGPIDCIQEASGRVYPVGSAPHGLTYCDIEFE